MELLILGLLLFLGTHSVSIVRPGQRAAFVARLGLLSWHSVYGSIALTGLLLTVWGYGEARHAALVLYVPPVWMRHLALLLMLPVFPLLFAAYLPGRIQTATKHPMLLAVKVWAFAHLLANGTLPDLILFGAFLAWAVADRISLKHRATILPTPGAPPARWNDLVAVVGGLTIYLLFLFWLHRALIGVAPIA